MGISKSIDEGYVSLKEACQVQKGLNLYPSLKACPPHVPHTNEWHYGLTGTGKSRSVRSKFPAHYIKGCNLWWCNYAGEDTVIIEELGPRMLGPQHLKIWADHYPFAVEGKGYSGKIRPARIVVTSNYSIQDVYPDERDWKPLERRFTVHHYEEPFIM